MMQRKKTSKRGDVCLTCPKRQNGWCPIKAQTVAPEHPKCEYGKKLDR